MPPLEYSSLDKFLASIGLVIMGTAGLVQLFVQRELAVLTIPRTELAGLTRTARITISAKQEQAQLITTLAPYLSLVLLTVGLLVLTLGIRLWVPRQAAQDREREARLRRHSLRPLDAAEKAERAVEEVLVTTEVSAQEALPRTGQPSGDVPAAGEGSGPQPGTATPPTDQPGGFAAMVREYRDVELLVYEKLAAALRKTHDVEADVALAKPSQADRGAADVVALSRRPGGTDLFVEVKYSRSRLPRNLPRHAMLKSVSMVAQRPTAKRTSLLSLFIVNSPQQGELEAAQRAVDEAATTVAELAGVRVAGRVLTLDRLESMSPTELRDLVAPLLLS